MDEIVNKVANSKLLVFDLEDYYPDDHVIALDISQWLFGGFILKETEFREQLKNTDWSLYEDKYVALFCSEDAILPAWAYTLVAVHLAPFALKVIHGDKILARLNSGELILNQKQQSGLFGMLNEGGSNVNIGLDGAFKLSGSDLELVIERAINRNSRKR